MKKLISILAVAVAFAAHGEKSAPKATAQPVTQFNLYAMPVYAPFMSDSVDMAGKKYDRSDLLKSPVSPKLTLTPKAVAGDSVKGISLNGYLVPGQMAVLRTNVRAPRYAKGTFKATSRLPLAIYVDGKEQSLKKDSQADSVSPGTTSASVTMEPERDMVLEVRVLAPESGQVLSDSAFVAVEFVPDNDFSDITLANGPNMKHRLNLGDTHFSNRANGVSLSPDGRWLLLKSIYFYDKKTSRYTTSVLDLKTGRVSLASVKRTAKWLPQQNILYYTEKEKNTYNLYFVDPATGTETLRASGLAQEPDDFFPDGRSFIYYKSLKAKKEEGPLRRYKSPDDRIPGQRDRMAMMQYDLETGLSRQLTFGNTNVYLCDISRDGKNLLLYSMEENPTVRPFYKSGFYQLNMETMAVDTIVAPGPQFINSGIYSPDGKQILFLGSASAFDGLGRNLAPEYPIANDYDVQLYIMDLDSRKVRCVSLDFNPSVDQVISWNPVDNRIYLLAEEGFEKTAYALNPKTGKFDRLPTDVAVISAADVPTASATRMAYTGQDYTYAGRAFVLDLKTGKNTLIAAPYDEHMEEIQLGQMEPWNFKAKDGSEIEGWMCLPPDFDANKKYPLIVYYYGGTSPCQRTMLQPYTPQLLASRDYVVYILNPSGTTGYGQNFSARHVNAWGDYTAKDIIEGVTKFCDAHPFVDRDRIGCMGASYGGFMTQYLQTLTPMFAAAVSHAGISNVTSYWGEGYWGYSYNGVAAADSYPWSNPDLFTKHGSLFNAEKIHTPLLLLHGTADTNVPIGESIQLFNALRVLGRDVEFVSVDGENHFINDIDKRQQWQNTIMAFFAKYLQNDPRWWNALYPKN